jgi:hypothetical protein
MNTLLKVLPTEQIHFYPSTRIVNGNVDRYYITDANKTFMSAIMLIN